jgi:hypothetical protein
MLDTARGPIAVQHLHDDEALVDEEGQIRPLRQRCSVSIPHLSAHDRRRSRPVLIQQGAIANGIPDRPILLPATARIGIPGFGFAEVADLTNGATLTRPEPEPSAAVWHGVVSEGGNALIIGGLAVEGFAICTDADEGEVIRGRAEAMLHACADPPTDPAPAFELPERMGLAVPRRTLADRALLLGHARIADPGLMLRVGHAIVAPTCDGAWCRFALPGGTFAHATLLSRHAVPAVLIGNDEKRRLGVAVCRIMAGRRRIPLAHWSLGSGWHAPEESWRWTDGAATLRLPHGADMLAFEIANTLPVYPFI